MPHQKHTKLTRPFSGQYGRYELAIIGTPCGHIKHLAYAIVQALKNTFKVAYLDADHQGDDELVLPSALAHGADILYTDKIDFHRWESRSEMNAFQWRPLLNEQDLVLINGNHFKGANQLVFIDKKKEKSLERKLDRLTNIKAFILQEGEEDIFPFLKKHITNWSSIPIFSIKKTDEILQFVRQELQTQVASINSLILAGGKSQRMGEDKSKLEYYGKPQYLYLKALLEPYCENVFLSARAEQDYDDITVIDDQFIGLGPYGGILSAFRKYPNKAWLVVACDLPLLTVDAIKQLVEERDPSKIATAFYNPATDFPEPLITLWEPKSYIPLLQYLGQGYSCPRKVLINSDIQLITIGEKSQLLNANTPDDRKKVLDKIDEIF